MTEGQGPAAPEGFVGGPGSDHTGTLHLGAWVPTEKPQDRLAMADHLDEEEVQAAAGTAVYYKPQGPIDQGQTPECVGHCGRYLELATPNPEQWTPGDAQVPDTEATHLYNEAQKYDGISGQHDGTTNHGLVIAMQNLGKIQGNVAWAQGPDDVLGWLRTKGAVMMASEWDASMFQLNADGYLVPNGQKEGGHQYFLFGATPNDDVWGFMAWGGQWGMSGTFTDKVTGQQFTLRAGVFKLARSSLQTLFNDGYAEGCAPLKVGQAPPPPPQPQPQHKPDWQINGGYERYASNVLVFRGPNAAWGSSWRVYGWYELHADKSVTYYPPIS